MALMESKRVVSVSLVPWENYSTMDWTLIPLPWSRLVFTVSLVDCIPLSFPFGCTTWCGWSSSTFSSRIGKSTWLECCTCPGAMIWVCGVLQSCSWSPVCLDTRFGRTWSLASPLDKSWRLSCTWPRCPVSQCVSTMFTCEYNCSRREILENKCNYLQIFYFRSYKNKTGKMRSFSEAMRPFVPFFAYFCVFMAWVHWSPSNIMEREPRIVFLLSGTIFSNISVSRRWIFVFPKANLIMFT